MKLLGTFALLAVVMITAQNAEASCKPAKKLFGGSINYCPFGTIKKPDPDIKGRVNCCEKPKVTQPTGNPCVDTPDLCRPGGSGPRTLVPN